MKKIYLDYNATTPVAPSVCEMMQPFLTDHFGNPSSAHSLGRAAAEAIEDARAQVGVLLGCEPEEIVFTSGGTEANNLAIKGVLMTGGDRAGGHVIISAIEHPAVTEPIRYLERMGHDVSIVGCDDQGRVDPEEIESEFRQDTVLVSLMLANNEVGTIQSIRRLAEWCQTRGVMLHTDASQAVGKIPVQVDELGVDLLTLAGHKMYAPKGVGALFVRTGVDLEPLLHGAGHERGRRAGTENTPYLVGLGQAARLAYTHLDENRQRMETLRDQLQRRLEQDIPGLVVHAGSAERLPNTLCVSFPGADGMELLRNVPEICASTGSACHSGAAISDTLTAMGASPDQIRGMIRLSLGWGTTGDEIERAADLLVNAWERR